MAVKERNGGKPHELYSQGRTFFLLHPGETQIYSVWVKKGQQKGLVLHTSEDSVLIEEGSTEDWKE